MELLEQLYQAMLSGQVQTVMTLTEEAIREGIRPKEILEKALMRTALELGKKYSVREIPITKVLISSRALLACLHMVVPLFNESEHPYKGRVVAGTVAGDVHDLGKTIVTATLRGAGFEVIELGIDVPPEKFKAAVEEYKPDLLALSCLLTTTLASIRETIALLERAGLRRQVKILIGGGPVTASFAKAVGADYYGPDAYSAVRQVLSELKQKDYAERNTVSHGNR